MNKYCGDCKELDPDNGTCWKYRLFLQADWEETVHERKNPKWKRCDECVADSK
jgi:hypothetical protein